MTSRCLSLSVVLLMLALRLLAQTYDGNDRGMQRVPMELAVIANQFAVSAIILILKVGVFTIRVQEKYEHNSIG